VVGATVGEGVVGAADVGTTVVSFMSFLSKSVAFGGVVVGGSVEWRVALSSHSVDNGAAIASFT